MKINLKINTESRVAIFMVNTFVIGVGLIVISYISWMLYNNLFGTMKSIESTLTLRDKVNIESVNGKDLDMVLTRLKRQTSTDYEKIFKNPFISKATKK